MKVNLHLKIVAFFTLTLGLNSFAQVKITQNSTANTHEKCGFNTRHQHLLQNDPNYVLKRQQEENHIYDFERNPVVEKVVVSIPVVVHVIHTGQAIGVGANISDAQVQSAIDNLNDAYSNTSTPFTTYTGLNTEIQFCLAQRDENGNPTTGIVRVNGSGVANYSTQGIISSNEIAVKALSQWDNTKYYNFWIVSEIDDNDGGQGTQGYAYFPGAGASVDGAVMLYNAFGYDPNGALGYNLKSYTNRNTTPIHEVGHALNLHHTFEGDGDGSVCPVGNGCGTNVGDCVADTPPHKRSGSDCVVGTNSCDGGSSTNLFIHNFMDYSSDVCTTEFTSGQSTRMMATLTGGGLRASLTTSDGCNPANNQFDASITSIVSPVTSYCQTTFSPQIMLRNFGLTTLISVTINYNIDGGTNQVFNWSGSLATGSSELVTLNSMTTTIGAHTFNATASLPNGFSDNFTANDAASVSFTITTSSALPFTQDFEAVSFPPTGWSRISADSPDGSLWNANGIKQWERRTTGGNGASTASAAMNHFNYAFNAGTTDELITPTIDLSSASTPQFQFKVAYEYYGVSNEERLRVLISNDCGVNFSEIYNKSGTALQTKAATGNSFTPSVANDWRLETIDLSAYAGDVITLKFESTNGYGNNLFIDDINVTGSCVTPVITSNPSNSTRCSGTNTSFSVANSGGGSFVWQISTDGGTNYSNLSNGGVYSGVNTATLNLSNVTVSLDDNMYRCVITNTCGSVNSNGATLTVNATPATPVISAGGPLTFCDGGSVTLTSSASTGNTWSTGATTQSITVSTTSNITVTVSSGGCNSTSASQAITVNDCSSLDEETVSMFTLYPNPANSKITIKGENIALINKVVITDNSGRIVYTVNYNSMENKEIDIVKFASGIYTLILTGENFEEQKQLTIIK